MAAKKKCDWKGTCMNCNTNGGGVYFLGFIGAAIYFITNSTGFWMGVVGFLKAIVWPVFLTIGLFRFLAI